MIERVRRYGLLGFAVLNVCLLTDAKPLMARECIDCHAGVFSQFRGNSHHVQGVDVSGRHCHACHWEALANGAVNEAYHNGVVAVKKPSTARDAKVDLVVWENGRRPTVYKKGRTAVTFLASAIGTATERAEVAKVTRHCLGCHSDGGNSTRPFAGDPNQPFRYAWDGQSIASRYSQTGTTTWGKYSTAATNKKQRVTKSFSAHGNTAANRGGWKARNGYDGDIPSTRGGAGARNVECFDCHNSHGSTVAGVTSSYRTFDGSLNGGILKQTVSGRGGYSMDYSPSINADSNSKNPYNAGAGLCFDCHENAMTGATPWGYRSTFGAGQPIMGYKDTLRFGPGVKGSASRYANRQTRSEIASSHLKAGKFLNYSAGSAINGLCTPCHDPHGVSRTLGENMSYAVPLLKGTWLTSPYREDSPPAAQFGKGANAKRGGNANPVAAAGSAGSVRAPMSMPDMRYNVDRNTFGDARRITENDEKFAGLCLKCHSREKSDGNTKAERIHRTVKGWGNNREHSFPCSKCHQAHNSGLPRLMQTNCFEEGPSGLRENSGMSWLPYKNTGDGGAEQATGRTADSAKSKIIGCHVRQFGKPGAPAVKSPNDQWKELKTW